MTKKNKQEYINSSGKARQQMQEKRGRMEWGMVRQREKMDAELSCWVKPGVFRGVSREKRERENERRIISQDSSRGAWQVKKERERDKGEVKWLISRHYRWTESESESGWTDERYEKWRGAGGRMAKDKAWKMSFVIILQKSRWQKGTEWKRRTGKMHDPSSPL